ncbi:MAG: bifunctional cobalt-precorrin-7 (C(5))-methyltransferase/cobalt-precorrin-6B (C(15))-methyltransferase, partial [Rikenellaceae bacterium]
MSVRVIIIGIDDSSTPYFTPTVLSIIERGRCFSGGVRHHQIVSSLLPDSHEWIDITPPMESLFEHYKRY